MHWVWSRAIWKPTARKPTSGSRVEHLRETVYSPGMCSSPTSPDGVSHKAHVLSIKPSRPGLHAGTSRSEEFSHPANITMRSWEPQPFLLASFMYIRLIGSRHSFCALVLVIFT